jgi:hypothetical protein
MNRQRYRLGGRYDSIQIKVIPDLFRHLCNRIGKDTGSVAGMTEKKAGMTEKKQQKKIKNKIFVDIFFRYDEL